MDILNYQKEAIDIINKAFELNHIAHAYIFEGSAGSGTLDAAYYFAEKMLCTADNKPCGVCDNCKNVINRVHSNIFLIEPISDSIKKDQINSLIHEDHMTSVTGKNRIYIIKDANAMNRASANTLLKTLEEPSSDNYFILLTPNTNSLLETIASRCQIIRFKPINKTQIENLLKDSDINVDASYLLSELFDSYDEAKTNYLSNLSFYEYIFKVFNELSLKKDIYINYLFNKNFFQNKDNVILLMKAIIVFEKELIKYLNNESIHFVTYINKIDKESLNINNLIKNIEVINEAIEKVNSNVNIDLVYTNLTIRLI